MMNNRIGTVVLVVTTLLVVIASEVRGQDDYGRVDVLGEWFRDSGVSTIQAYGDTVIRSFTGRGPRPSRDIQRSVDGGRTWESIISVPRLQAYIPCVGSRLIAFWGISGTSDQQEYWVFRHGRVSYRDTLGINDKTGMLLFREMRHHPTDEDLIYAVGSYQGRVSTYETLYTSTDDGRTWREYELPEATQGLSRKLKVCVDYADPKLLFVSVNGGDGVGNPEIDEWYRLELESGGLTPHPKIGILNNYWRDNSTVFSVYRSFKQNVPLLCDFDGTTCDTLWWSANIAQVVLRTLGPEWTASSAPITDWYNESSGAEGFHPQRRDVYITRVSVRTNDMPSQVYHNGALITTDTGRTWKWLLRPGDSWLLFNISLDPLTMSVYLTRTRGVAPNEEYYAMLKVSPDVMSVQEQRNDPNTSVWPTPASETVTIRCPREINDVLRVSDVYGRSYECSWFHENDESTVLTVSHLPSGIYYVDVLTHERRWSIPVIVHH